MLSHIVCNVTIQYVTLDVLGPLTVSKLKVSWLINMQVYRSYNSSDRITTWGIKRIKAGLLTR